MRRIRRKRRYTWMPTLGGLESAGDASYNTSYFNAAITADAPSKGANNLYVTPIIPDYTLWQTGNSPTGPSLRDTTEGQDWLLKRIVGKLHIGVAQFAAAPLATTPTIIKVAAAFFVARADDADPNIPDLNNDEIDPLGTKNVRQPWIWRRNWVLMNGLSGTAPQFQTISEVNNNGFSVADGPHIDSKVSRRIRREERLWFVINAYGYNNMFDTFATYDERGDVQFSLDYRVLGAMRRSNNRSTF